MAQIEAKEVFHFISTDDGATLKRLVCTTEAGMSRSKNTTQTDTRCGQLTSTGNDTIEFTGTLVTDDDPDNDELSMMDLQQLMSADEEFIIYEKNESESYFLAGTGKFTQLSTTNSQGQWSTASYTISVSGIVALSDASI